MRPPSLQASAEMNITPLIDVLLVLLVVVVVVEYTADRHSPSITRRC